MGVLSLKIPAPEGQYMLIDEIDAIFGRRLLTFCQLRCHRMSSCDLRVGPKL